MPFSTRSWVQISAYFIFLVFLCFASFPFIDVNATLKLFTHPQVIRTNAIHSSKLNVWADLDNDEAERLSKFLFESSELNLTKVSTATSHDNVIRLVEVLQPNKTDALAYLNGTSGPPEKWARVAIDQGTSDEARIVNYMVGPLPPDKYTVVRPLLFCYNSDRNYAVNPIPDMGVFSAWQLSLAFNMSDILEDLLGGHVDPEDPNSLGAHDTIIHFENGTYTYWMQLYRQDQKSGASSLLPQGLYIKMTTSTRDPSKWEFLQCYYNRHLYNSVSDLRAAMQSPGFIKIPLNLDGDWTDTEDFSEGISGRQQPPPVMIQPEGPRFLIDEEQRFISWMGFEFFISTASDTGVFLHDIRFNGDSVIYEIGLQEALSHYAGDDPQQGILQFLDGTFMMGLRMFELVPGYDCPAYATYLPATFHMGDESITIKNSLCIFEYTSDHVLQRHTTDSHVSISRNTYLVVRSVSTIGNYDYTFDYIFYLDGTIEVKVRASGFIFGSFWAPTTEKRDRHGYRVQDAMQTSMHDHVMNFKVDLDIAGTANTFTRVAIEPLTRDYEWDFDASTPRNTMRLVDYPVETETGMNWPGNAGEFYVVTNEEEENAWGEKRGYRIAAGTGMGNPSHLTIINSTSLRKSSEWASRDLWVLKQKDAEPRSASPWNWYEPSNPLVDFSRFVDGEDILQEDLVVYFNLGSHHVPHSGDIPNTLMHTSASSIVFTPFNFHDRDPSRRSAQGVKVVKGDGGSNPQYFGGTYKKDVNVKAADLEPDLEKYNSAQGSGGAKTGWNWIPGIVPPDVPGAPQV